MLAEKLLLNLLITIAPVLLCSALIENKNKSPVICGLLQSIAALACMTFSYSNYDFHWDLRYASLILAIFYDGPIAGGMVLFAILGFRIFQGGETVNFSIINSLLVVIFSLLIRKNFWSHSPKKRILFTTLAGGCSLVICYFSLNIFHLMSGDTSKIMLNIPDVFLIGIINTLALALAAKLNEELIERTKMREEIQRAEKLNTLAELAASIAHEVRNPLTVVKGFLQLMQQQEAGKNYEYLSLVLVN